MWDAASFTLEGLLASGGEAKATLQGHEGLVNSVSFSPPEGALLASGSGDNTVRLWDVASGESVATLQGHEGRVNSVSFSPEGALLASGSGDNTVRLWDMASGESIATLQGHQRGVTSVSFSPNGLILASGDGTGTIRLWYVVSGQELAILQGHQQGATLVSFLSEEPVLASGSFSDGTILLWDMAPYAILLAETLIKSSGDEQQGPAGASLADPLVVSVLDRNGNGVAGVTVTFAVTAGGGVLSLTTATTDADGRAASTLTLGREPGINTVEATVAGLDPVTFTSHVTPSTPTAIHASPSLPEQTALLANYPNPFNSSTQLAYRLAAPGLVRLTIYNVQGQPVRTLVDQVQPAGEYQVSWDARDQEGATVAAGVYLTRLRHADDAQTRRLLYLK